MLNFIHLELHKFPVHFMHIRVTVSVLTSEALGALPTAGGIKKVDVNSLADLVELKQAR